MKTFIFFKKKSNKKLFIFGGFFLLLASVFVLNQMVFAQDEMEGSQFRIRALSLEIQKADSFQTLPLSKKEGGKEEIIGKVKLVDKYLISDIPENEFLEEHSDLKFGFQDLSISLEVDQPLFDKENFYYPLSFLDKTGLGLNSLLGIENQTLPEYRLVKEIDKSKGIQTNLDLSKISLATHYQMLDAQFFPSVKQTIIITNNDNQDLNLSLLLKNRIDTDRIYWDDKEYFISENPQKFQNPDEISFYSQDEKYVSFYNYSDIPDEFLPELWVEKENSQSYLIITLNISLPAGRSRVIDPAYLTELMDEYGFKYQVIDWQRPITNAGWAEDVKEESLHIKFDYQLDQMETNLEEKLPKVMEDFYWIIKHPDAKRMELEQGGLKENDIEEELQSQVLYYRWKVEKINQSLERIKKEKELRYEKLVIRNPIGTTYYLDCDNGSSTGNGLATTSDGANAPFLNLDQFTEVARSAGDKVIIRRGNSTTCDDGTDLLFTSDGSLTNPIVIEADYDDAWEDFVDLSATGTATLTFGSKTITFTADMSGDISAGDWLYVSGEDAREYAYEVKTVSTVTITLYLPYKGNQAGSGKTIINMGAAPIWNTAAGNFQWNFDNDNYWKVQGIHIRGTDLNGTVEIDSCYGHIFKDCIFEGNGVGDYGLKFTDFSAFYTDIRKSRTYNHMNSIQIQNDTGGFLSINNCLFDTTFYAIFMYVNSIHITLHIENTETQNISIYGFYSYPNSAQGIMKMRNSIFTYYNPASNLFQSGAYIEDHNQTIGDNWSLSGYSTDDTTPILQSETTIVRSGGGATSIRVNPSTKLSTYWEFSKVKFFEYPIYADTSSKQYDVYMRSSSTDSFTADPTASELWIECEYWGHATNNHRKITKSTGVLDFNGTTNWASLSVTCQPSQTGILYLRGYYAKTKETGKDNIFFVDIASVIQ